MVLPHEGTMIGAGDRGDERDEAGACGADDKLLISVLQIMITSWLKLRRNLV